MNTDKATKTVFGGTIHFPRVEQDGDFVSLGDMMTQSALASWLANGQIDRIIDFETGVLRGGIEFRSKTGYHFKSANVKLIRSHHVPKGMIDVIDQTERTRKRYELADGLEGMLIEGFGGYPIETGLLVVVLGE